MQIIKDCGMILSSLDPKAVMSKVTKAIGYCHIKLTEGVRYTVRFLTCIYLHLFGWQLLYISSYIRTYIYIYVCINLNGKVP